MYDKIEKGLIDRVGVGVFISIFISLLGTVLFQNYVMQYVSQFLGLFVALSIIIIGMLIVWNLKVFKTIYWNIHSIPNQAIGKVLVFQMFFLVETIKKFQIGDW